MVAPCRRRGVTLCASFSTSSRNILGFFSHTDLSSRSLSARFLFFFAVDSEQASPHRHEILCARVTIFRHRPAFLCAPDTIFRHRNEILYAVDTSVLTTFTASLCVSDAIFRRRHENPPDFVRTSSFSSVGY